MFGYRDLIYLTLRQGDSNDKQVLAPMLLLEESVPHWADFAGDDVEFEWLCDAIAVKVDTGEVPLFRIQVTFTKPRRKEFTFYFDPTSDEHRRWLTQLAETERFALLDPNNTNAMVNPWVSLKGSSIRKLLDDIDSEGQLRNATSGNDEDRKCDTVISVCDLSASLHGLPAEPLNDLLSRMSEREFLKGAGPIDMLKVFISEHLCADVEERFGPYAERQLIVMAGKDFMLNLSFDSKMGIASLEIGQYIGSRLVHWNRHYEALLLESAKRHGIQEIVNALEGQRAATVAPQPACSKPKKSWWQFWK